MNLTAMYRGSLTSCNYACSYCPFAKRIESKSRLQRDQNELRRFVSWVADQTSIRWQILFTPWGEGLVRKWYRQAIVELSRMSHMRQVAIQTNLSASLDWLAECDASHVGLWATFHPSECLVDDFLRQVDKADHTGATVSVGAVGVPENSEAISNLRARLPSHIRLWINAQQPRSRPYMPEEIEFFQSIDPDFSLTLKRQLSFGRTCQAGETVFTIDGGGDMRRCHFVSDVIGNIYESDWLQSLQPRTCPRRYCDCYLGIAQLMSINLPTGPESPPFQRLSMRER